MKTIARILLALIVLTCVAVFAIVWHEYIEDHNKSPERIRERIEEARQIGDDGDNARAIELLEQIVEDSDNTSARSELLDRYLAQTDFDNAIRIAEKERASFSANRWPTLLLAPPRIRMIAYWHTADDAYLDQAAADINALIRKYEGWLELYMFKALLEFESGEIEDARKTLAAVEELSPYQERDDEFPQGRFQEKYGHWLLLYMVGSVECTLGNYAEGVKYFERAGAFEAINTECVREMAVAEVLNGNFDASAKHFDIVLGNVHNRQLVDLVYERLCLATLMEDEGAVATAKEYLAEIQKDVVQQARNADPALQHVDFQTTPKPEAAREYLEAHFAPEKRQLIQPQYVLVNVLHGGDYP